MTGPSDPTAPQPTPQPTTPQPTTPQPTPHPQATGAAWYPPPARPNPFAGVPVRDYVTDAVAFVLLCASLAQGWSLRYWAWERVEVVLVTIVSVLSLGVFYVARASGVAPRVALLVRGLANVPYVLVVLVYAVLDAVNGVRATSGEPFLAGGLDAGLGVAVALGLAGVAFAVSPRQVESDDPALAGPAARAARVALWSLLAVMLVEQALALVVMAVTAARWGVAGHTWLSIVANVLVVLAIVALAVGPLLGTLRGSATWRWVLVAVAATAVLAPVPGAPDALAHTARGVLSGNGAYAFLPAAGALALAPAVARAMRPVEPPVRLWFDVARAAWLLLAGVAAAAAVAWLLQVVQGSWDGGSVPGWAVVVVVLLAVVAVAAFVARATFAGDPLGARPMALAVTGAIVVLGAVAVGLGPQTRSRDVLELAVAVGLPVLVLVVLTVPRAVRELYAQHRASAPAAPAATAPSPQPWGHAAAPAAGHGFTVAQASDPATDLAVLAAIVERAPELRPYVALNPSTYPDLLAWLAQLHDPAVDAALAARRS